jgi:serine/threonine protein kinase
MKWHIEVIQSNIEPLFAGDSEIDQIFKIFQMYGTPNEKIWPGITKLPEFKVTFPQFRGKGINAYCSNLDEAGLDLLGKMIVYDPCKRISAKSALNHVFYNLLSPISMT